MAHYAELDNQNKVIRVLVVANEVTHATPDGSEDELLGATFLADLLGGEWVATSYNGNKRGRYAGPGYAYDREHVGAYVSAAGSDDSMDEYLREWVHLPDGEAGYRARVGEAGLARLAGWSESIESWKGLFA